MLLLYAAYIVVRWLVAAPAAGLRHANELLAFERRFGLSWERSLQAVALAHPTLVRAANGDYAFGFLPVLFGAAALAAWRAPRAFVWWLRVFAVTLALGLIGFAAFPLTPPRLLPANRGFVDTLQRFGPHYYVEQYGSGLVTLGGKLPRFVNDYAAMPSLHVAWSIVAVGLLAAAIGRRWIWAPGTLYVGLMALTVVVTGNHYVLDVLGGLSVAAVALATGDATTRMRGWWSRARAKWTAGQERTALWVFDAVTAWEAEGRITAEEAATLRAEAASPAFRAALRALASQIAVSFVAPFPLDMIVRPILVVGALALAGIRRLRHRGDRAAWDLARDIHTPLVALLSALPGLGSYAYLAARPLRANGLLLRVLLDAMLLALPGHRYERSRLRRTIARAPATPSEGTMVGNAPTKTGDTDPPLRHCSGPHPDESSRGGLNREHH